MYTLGISVGLYSVLRTKTSGMSCPLHYHQLKSHNKQNMSCQCVDSLHSKLQCMLSYTVPAGDWCFECRLLPLQVVSGSCSCLLFQISHCSQGEKKKKISNQTRQPAPLHQEVFIFFNVLTLISAYFMLSRCLLVHSNSCFYIYISVCEQV